MNQSAVYRSSKRELDQPEADLPVKRPSLQPIAAHRVICRFLTSRDSPHVFVPNSPVNDPPVTVPNSPLNKPPAVTVPNSKSPAVIATLPIMDLRRGDGPQAWNYPFLSRMSLAFSDHGAAQRMVELQKEEEGEAKKRGYTQQEYRICRGYLFKRKFEKSPEPLSGRLERLKKVLDQIRDTRGYGVTGDSPCPGHEELIEGEPNPIASQSLRCILDEYESSKNPRVRQCVERVEDALLGEILEKMRKRYLCAGVVNLVETSNSYRLVTFHVHEEGTAPPAEGQPREIAEALFRNPILAEIYLTEWKIRKGEEVLFSTGDALLDW